jgi:hypothetical protein
MNVEHFDMGEARRYKYDVQVTLNIITSTQHSIQIHQSAQEFTHLRSLVRHFVMIEATGLEIRRRDHFKCHHLNTNFIQIHQEVRKFTHLRNLNVRYFGMVEATGLKMWHQGHLQCHDHYTKFHPHPPISSKYEPTSQA